MTSTGPAGERDALADFLSRYRIAGESISPETARSAADRILENARLPAHELAARGYRHLTVVHGDVETAEDEAAKRQLWSWGDRHPGAVQSTIGTNDTTTWLLAPPRAETNLASLEAVALAYVLANDVRVGYGSADLGMESPLHPPTTAHSEGAETSPTDLAARRDQALAG